jgi:Peptidase family M50
MFATDLTPLSVALVPVAAAVNVVAHEAAHALVARSSGCRVARVSIGMGPTLRSTHVRDVRLIVRPLPLAGHVLWESRGASRAVHVCVSLAGPLATLTLAGGLVALGEAIAAPAARGLLVTGALGLAPCMPGSDTYGLAAVLRRGAPAPTDGNP